jgi:hypothetical protein
MLLTTSIALFAIAIFALAASRRHRLRRRLERSASREH